MTPDEFWTKVDRRGPDECWPWRQSCTNAGYGQVYWDGKNQLAHRVAFRLSIGPIPDGKQLDHVAERGCSMRSCCNPSHLEPVTSRQNTLRGSSPAAQHARKIECVNGHAYTPENTYRRPSGKRECRRCRRDQMSRFYAAQAA